MTYMRDLRIAIWSIVGIVVFGIVMSVLIWRQSSEANPGVTTMSDRYVVQYVGKALSFVYPTSSARKSWCSASYRDATTLQNVISGFVDDYERQTGSRLSRSAVRTGIGTWCSAPNPVATK